MVASQSYFEFMGRPSLLRHLWSLAVEEQFYVFWPLLFAIGIRLLRRRGLLFAILAGIVASTVWMAMLYQPEVDSARIYFGTDTRAAGLLVGAALAFVWSPWRLPARAGLARSLSLDAVGLGALGLLIWLFCKLDEFQPFLYRGGFLLVDLATAAALAVVVHPHAHLGRGLLAWQPLRWVGTRSYGIYLWHWPIFMITRPHLDVSIDGMPLLLLRLGATMLLAELSYRYVETPFRRGAFGRALTAWSKARMTGRWWKILYRQPLSQVTGHQRPYQYRESGR
ncbi:MAG: acyltransferase [Dehalococcoidia bacterium]|nr:acyltransferase [Dehalococcoidia bacterium]